jgi:hypothetical protein
MEPYRFTTQENQFTGECLPCTKAKFYTTANSASVNNTITTRQAIEKAIDEGQPLDNWINCANFRNFCQKQASRPRAGESFAALAVEQKLQQWTNSQKMWLPCFIFAVKEFAAIPKTDKQGNPVLDAEEKEILFRRRLQSSIMELSGLFMFDGDHLPIDPREVYERTLRQGFPWEVRLAHKTSSGHGLRLVCEANPDVGNIADNQIELGRELGLLGMLGTTGKPVCDDSCIDASRISYAPRMCDIYYIDEDNLFNLL